MQRCLHQEKKVQNLFYAIVMKCTQLCHLKFKPMRKKGTIDKFVHVSTLLYDQFKKDETGVCSGERARKIVSKHDGRRPPVRPRGG
jgi:hypothetical protein